MDSTSITHRTREEERLAEMRESYRHELLDAESRGELLDAIRKLEKKLGGAK